MGAPLFVLLCLLSGGPSAESSSAVRHWQAQARRGRRHLDRPPGCTACAQGKVVLDQRNLSFYPRVLAVQVGTKVDFPNHDRVFHNVFSFRDGKRFDLGLYPVGAVKTIPFDQTGLSRVFCNIHPGMAAYIMVVDTPAFVVSDRSGKFVLTDVTRRHVHLPRVAAGGEILNGSIWVYAGAVLDVQWR
jgi:plastocyanin